MQPYIRQPRRRTAWIIWFIPVVLVCCLGVFLFAPALPGVVLQVVGFTPKGSVDAFWQEQAVVVTPFSVIPGVPAAPPPVVVEDQLGEALTPTPVVVTGQGSGGNSAAPPVSSDYTGWFQSYTVPGSLNVSSPAGSFSVNTAEAYAQTAWFGTAADGYPLGLIEYSETALDGICSTWLQGCETEQFSVQSVDFRPGGLVVNGRANVGGISQSLGVVLTLGADMKSFVAQGVVIGGQLYGVPTTGDIAVYVEDALTRSNEILRDFRVTTGGMSVGLVQIRITDTMLTLFFR